MSQRLLNILRRLGSPAANPTYTHEIVCGGVASRWEVNKTNYAELLKEYCSLVSSHEEVDLCLSERPKDVMPVIISLNLAFQSSRYSEPFDEDFILTFIYHIQQSLIKNLSITDDASELTCVVLESDTYTDDKDRKRIDLRFQFPTCKIDSQVQKKFIIPTLIRRLRSENILGKFFHQPIGDWESIIDYDATTKPLPMFGSVISQGASPMTLHKIYGPTDLDSIINHDTDEFERDLDDEFNPMAHSYVFQGILNGLMFNEPPNRDFWLPAFLSVDFWHRVTLQRVSSRNTPASINSIFGDGKDTIYNLGKFGKGEDSEHIDAMSKMDLCEYFSGLWSPNRILKKQYWKDIGEAFFDADLGDDNGLKSWIDIMDRTLNVSETTPDFLSDGVNTSCENMYYTLRQGRTTVKTLGWHAREDSKQQYDNWHKTWYAKSMEQAVLRQTHVAIAKAFCRIYWLDIICTHIGKKVIWYKFDRHRWREVPGGHSIRTLMSEDFVQKFREMRHIISDQSKNAKNSEDAKEADNIMSKINDLIRKLETAGYLTGIMTMVSDRLAHDDLGDLLDENGEILGLTNGVLIATRDGIEFRAGRPEDYVTRCTNVGLRKDYHWEHPHVKAVTTWLHSVFVDDELYHHFMKWSASTLRGGNNDKHLSVWTGEGDNSKSMLVKLFEAVYGAYCIKMPISLASAGGRGNANGPSPAIARSRATRLCFMEEPGANTRFDSDLFKHLTGADRFFARLLKKNGGDIKPTFKLILMCNKIPSIPRDKAMENRLRIYAFLSTWVDDPVEAEAEYQMKYGKPHGRFFQMDNMFEDTIPGMASAALWAFFQYYPIYLDEGIRKTPEIIKKKTQEYWEDNDSYFQFTADQVEPAMVGGYQDPNSKIDLNQLYISFKMWHKDAFSYTKVPDKPKFKSEMITRWGAPVNGAWHGVRFKSQQQPGLDSRMGLKMA